ncbi:MAG: thiamine pyrophosphate-dependent enzyme [Candidatus Omnitrophica bacterium]|nr:thiamine pyrophosphate-dependent enzyme [Candidatus Omnitrophota bacterium]
MEITALTPEQKYLRRRILEISYKRRLSHLGSCLTAIDIIYAIYEAKKDNEKFILSNGHAGVALYAVLEKKGLLASPVIDTLNIHPDRNPAIGIEVSSGSLGQGLPIALGMALADRSKNVYCSTSDGEFAEGSVWEALRIGIEQKINNLKIVINFNCWGAYCSISLPSLLKRISGFGYNVLKVNGHDLHSLGNALAQTPADQPAVIMASTCVEQFAFLKGQDAHYYTMTSDDYKSALDAVS